ncbi:MAG TPA: tetratricopeptide repeat protein [Phycisphaerae bacterium]|nr:tetratricopeptide repeat protein [Phycisphaerae bacterium]
MLKSQDRFADGLRRMSFDDRPDPAHRDRLEAQVLDAWARCQSRRLTARLGRSTIRRAAWLSVTSRPIRYVLAAAAVIGIVCALSLVSNSPDGASTAWAMEQSAAALEGIRTVYIAGQTSDPRLSEFQCWARWAPSDGGLALRYESDFEVVVFHDGVGYCYLPDRGQVYVFEGLDAGNMRYWTKALQLQLWLGGAMLRTLREQSQDWGEWYGRDEGTGRRCVFVTGTYVPLGGSFWLQFDLETSLPVRAKLWRNPTREGTPWYDAQTIVCNEPIADERFELKTPEQVEIVDAAVIRDGRGLMDSARDRYEARRLSEAIALYQEVVDRFPDSSGVEQAWMMMGVCYENMGQLDKAIAALERAVQDSPGAQAGSTAKYYYLGSAYMRIGRRQEATEVLSECVRRCEAAGRRTRFPAASARKLIALLQPDAVDAQPE